MSLRQHSGKLVGLAVAVTALSLSFGGWALATHSGSTPTMQKGIVMPQVAKERTPGVPEGGTLYGDDYYKVENGVVYEYDDGFWQPKYDKKIENGIVYDYDDGRWQVEYDPSTYKAPSKQNNTQKPAPQQNNTAPKQNNNVQQKVAPKQNYTAPQTNTYPNSKYKVENGTVYEWDDGRWEPEYDKKSQNGAIYEYDDGRWEQDYDDWDDDDWDD